MLKKIRIKLGSLFWGHKSRLAFFLTVILLKVLWMEFRLVSIEEKCDKIYILFLKSLWKITNMLVNPLIQKVSEICGYVLGLIHFLYGHCFKLLALH